MRVEKIEYLGGGGNVFICTWVVKVAYKNGFHQHFPNISSDLMTFSWDASLSFLSSFICSNQPKFKSDLILSLQYPSETLLQKLTEENQCPFHLSTSPSLHYLAGLKGRAIVECFHNNVAEVIFIGGGCLFMLTLTMPS